MPSRGLSRPEQGGGIIVYVKDIIKFERRLDLECGNIECIWLEISLKIVKVFSGMTFLTINLIKYEGRSIRNENSLVYPKYLHLPT